MVVDATTDQQLFKIAVTAQPKEAFPGTNATLKVEVTCEEDFQLTGQRLSLVDSAGEELAQAVLGTDLGTSHGATLEFCAPRTVGTHELKVKLISKTGQNYVPEVAADLSITVVSHLVTVSAWKVPSAIVAGESARVFVGAKCSSNRSLASIPVVVRDHTGQQVWAGALSENTWPGTTALYFTEVDMIAPPDQGEYTWQVEASGLGDESSNVKETFEFLVRTVPAPEVEVSVVAKDHSTGDPVPGLQVVIHPYRAVTDKDGAARIKVVKGTYKLFVTGLNYVGFQTVVDVDADVTIDAELVVEKEVDHYDSYYR